MAKKAKAQSRKVSQAKGRLRRATKATERAKPKRKVVREAKRGPSGALSQRKPKDVRSVPSGNAPNALAGVVNDSEYELTTDLLATSDPLWRSLAKFWRRVTQGGTCTPVQWRALLEQVRDLAYTEGLRPSVGDSKWIVVMEPTDGAPKADGSKSQALLVGHGSAGRVLSFDLSGGFASPNATIEREGRSAAAEWAQDWLGARERQLIQRQPNLGPRRIATIFELDRERQQAELEALRKIQADARELVRKRPALKALLIAAFESFVQILWQYSLRAMVAEREKQPFDEPNPGEPSSAEIRALKPTERHAAMLYWLGGLIDAGSADPVIPKPETCLEHGDFEEKWRRFARWKERYPTDSNPTEEDGELRPQMLHPNLAAECYEYAKSIVGSAEDAEHGLYGLSRDQELILKVWSSPRMQPKRLLKHKIMAESKLRNKQTVGRLLQELTRMRLLDHPAGSRKGWKLTADGLRLLDAIASGNNVRP
jgi:hypothetical protein